MTFRAAVVQMSAVPFDKAKSTDKVISRIEEAAAEGAGLIVFPEATLSGYPKGLDFGARVGGRQPRGKEEYLRYYNGAIDVPGPETDRIGAAAKEAQAYVVIGVMEREQGTIYCTALHFGPDGSLLGKHRKLVPTAMERVIWGQGDGSTMPVYDTSLGAKLGTVICWENYMPLFRTYMYAKGVQLYCAPTADDRDVWLPSMQHIAIEGRCFVFSACQYATRGDYPEDYDAIQGDNADAVLFRGGSVIVSPTGEVLAGPNHESECMLYAEIDVDDTIRGKFDLDVVGHYSRPDVFRLLVDEEPKTNVISTEAVLGEFTA